MDLCIADSQTYNNDHPDSKQLFENTSGKYILGPYRTHDITQYKVQGDHLKRHVILHQIILKWLLMPNIL